MTSYQIDKELHNLELLKIRFGEGSLHNCEVMLKDLGDSKRLDAYVHNESKKGALDAEVASWLNGKILSASFWPSLNSENIKMHPMIDQQLQSYGRYYSLLKKPRALKWKPTLGVVKLNLSFEDGREVPFTVSPVLANLILHFQDKPSWKLAELAEVTELAVDAVRKRMVFWVGNGVCQEQPPPSGAGIGETVYTVVEKATGPVMQQTTDFAMEEDDAAAQANDAQDEVIRSYVFGMLTNFKMLPLERIHNMLKMFVSDPPYTKKIQELESLLNALIASEKLEFDGSNYSLKSS
ncbi:hypothetical protein GUITHDRAFT_101196 [Guillardia theta CCMP2712]|uniref:Anaphase-promoting complex subunit 2 n=1 Tax=Guillardia theta (strain CCMP2712) TaxID=905079 RepID=L1JZG3_GUITC|nr:hypothetical protein GUITHDRAFT_101196 [Guillardia theta CCMP2712]EKX53498.1 hypothetical protein GUITHDRAFT_101196 [Guillardia theta CCMP2712]|eukprot:XP_005840478.1 hypothetical protein GUITHDRAFT_101196 [Guillardia theta CCMP2712]